MTSWSESGERLTDDEVARVLRRASELDPAASVGDGDGMPVAAVEAAAAEVGLSPAAVRQAVAELRTGALDDHDEPVVCARVLPGACPACLDAVGRWLQGQCMVRARDRGVEQVWRPREDVLARVQRRLDLAAAIRLAGVDEVVVRAVEVEGGTLVRVTARLERPLAMAPTVGAGAGAVLGVGGAGFLGLLNVDPAVLGAVAAGVPAGAVLGFAGWRIGRNVLGNRRRRVAEAVDGVLDELERGRQPGGSPLERLALRARRIRGGDRA